MELSAPLYRLKRRAKALSRDEKIPLHQALDRIAAKEGFERWSLLAAKCAADAPSRELFARLTPGDLVLVGARPGHGKTLFSLELLVEAIQAGRNGVFFTLEYTEKDLLGALRNIGGDPADLNERFTFDNSDAINAAYIIATLAKAPSGTVVIVDYLQLLDQKRTNPDLMIQVRALKEFASARGVILVFISQIDRAYDLSAKPCPGLDDVRLPNPLDLGLFDKTCFLNDGIVQLGA